MIRTLWEWIGGGRRFTLKAIERHREETASYGAARGGGKSEAIRASMERDTETLTDRFLRELREERERSERLVLAAFERMDAAGARVLELVELQREPAAAMPSWSEVAAEADLPEDVEDAIEAKSAGNGMLRADLEAYARGELRRRVDPVQIARAIRRGQNVSEYTDE